MNLPHLRAMCLLLLAANTLAAAAPQPEDGVQPEEAAPQPARPQTQPAAGADESAGVDQAALDRLRRAAETIKAASTATYRLRTTATGLLASGTPSVDLQVKMTREGAGWKLRTQGEGKRRPTEEPQQVDAVFTDTQVTWIDFPAKIVSSKPVRNARGPALQIVFSARITELLAAEPLAKELAALEVVSLGQEEVDGTMCDIVAVRTRAKSSRTKWWISQADNFPRRIEKGIESGTRGGTSTVDLVNLQLGVAIPPEEFEIQTPEGFTRQATDAPNSIKPAVPAPTDRPPPEPESQPQPVTPPVTEPSTRSAEETPAPPVPPPARVDPPTPTDVPLDVELVDDQGTKVPLASLRGKPVVLVFLGSWSLPSRQAATEAQTLKAYCADQVPLLCLGVRERFPQRFGEFVKSRGADLRLFPVGDQAAAALNIRVLPAVVVLDAQGIPRSTTEGVTAEQWKSLPATIAQHGGPPAPAPAEPAPTPAPTDAPH